MNEDSDVMDTYLREIQNIIQDMNHETEIRNAHELMLYIMLRGLVKRVLLTGIS